MVKTYKQFIKVTRTETPEIRSVMSVKPKNYKSK